MSDDLTFGRIANNTGHFVAPAVMLLPGVLVAFLQGALASSTVYFIKQEVTVSKSKCPKSFCFFSSPVLKKISLLTYIMRKERNSSF